jgi:hypothetical protein
MDEKVVLTATQVLELTDIDDRSNQGNGWCDVSEVSKDVLKELERGNYIVTNEARTSGRTTGMGRRALENHVIRGSIEHGQMLLARQERVPTKPYESVTRAPNRDIPQRPVTKLVADGTAPEKTCVVEGCNEPRMVRRDGAEMTRCVKHHRENLSEKRQKSQEKEDRKILAKAATAIEAEESAATAQPDCDCGDCVHREVLDMLRAKHPEIDELVELMTRAKELRDSMGI